MDILKKIQLTIIGVLCIPMTYADDNEINIPNVSGNDIEIKINQVGYANTIQCYQTSSCYTNLPGGELNLVQYNDSGTINKIELWHLEGQDNIIRWGQGVAWDNATSSTYSYDGQEGGGHYARLDVHGDYNHLQGHQTNAGSTSGHTFTSLIFSDYNDIWVRQQYNGAKTINLTTYNDGNDITLRQKGSWATHVANITLSGTDPTTLNLLQQGTTTQSYSLSQNCATVGGCSVSVTQGN
jgi:hypothetical protein